MIEDAYKGIIPTIGNPLPEFVTPQLILSIMRDIHRATMRVSQISVQNAKSQGIQLSFKNPEFMEVIQNIETLVELEKRDLFSKYRLTYFEDAPSLIVHNAIEKFSKNNADFRRELNNSERRFHSLTQKIMQDQVSKEEETSIINETISI